MWNRINSFDFHILSFYLFFFATYRGMHIHYFAYCKVEKLVYMVHIHSCSHKHASIIIYSFFLEMSIHGKSYFICCCIAKHDMVYMQGTTVLLQVFEFFFSGEFDLKGKQLIMFSYNIRVFLISNILKIWIYVQT